jgi:tRNA U34 5-methylaminomethyl-2-thiouridine-forming methyltransferase MnmC
MSDDKQGLGKAELFITSDGSHSLYIPDMDEQYHSRHGAIQESSHVFIQSGLAEAAKLKQDISILEVGLGTGLNAFLTFLYAIQHQLSITYDAIEAFPLDIDLAQKLNYPEALNAGASRDVFEAIHTSKDCESIALGSGFTFKKYIQPLQQFLPEKKYDLI